MYPSNLHLFLPCQILVTTHKPRATNSTVIFPQTIPKDFPLCCLIHSIDNSEPKLVLSGFIHYSSMNALNSNITNFNLKTLWFENSQDRCISRQALWGHRVPAWYVTLKEDKLKELGAYSDHWVVCRSFEDAQAEAKRRYNGKEYMIAQDPDVLDTWFSSAIIPLSVLGWPDKTDDLKVFYPTSLIVTGHDTLFSWVAPMIMLCSKLGGDVPFRKLFLHHLINDKFGQKLSNASGNIVDPLDFIAGLSHDNLRKKLMDDGVPERDIKDLFPSEILPFGADCLRFGLVQSTHEVDINFDTRDFISGYRGSCLVLWKGARLALNIIGDNYVPPTEIDFNVMPFSCQWILCVLNMTIKKTGVLLESFELGQAIKTLKSWWVDFDSFVGLFGLYGDRDSDRATLWVCLDVGLRLFHPFMPFVTEELWQRLPHTRDTPESIMISEYPRPVQSWANERVEREMVVVCAISEFIKSNLSLLRSEEVFLFSCDEGKLEIIRGRQKDIEVFSKISGIKVLNDINDVPPKHRAHRVTKDLFIYTWNSY